MRRFSTLLASFKTCKQPQPTIERPLATSLITPKHFYDQSRFFSAQTGVIPRDYDHPSRIEFQQDYDSAKGVGVEKKKCEIRVLSIENVKPNKPTPDYLRSFKLSALDQIYGPSYVPLVWFYPNNFNGNKNIHDIVLQRSKLLKQSLSETLSWFYPFAGKYIDDNHVDCNDEGVYYVETRIEGDLSSFIAKPDYKLVQRLLPMPPNSTEPTRGFYLAMVQVNFFSCGGVAISMSNSHKLIDGCTYMRFISAWASAANVDKEKVYPNFDTSSLFPPNIKPPSYPCFPISTLTERPMLLKTGKCSTERFRFDAKALQALKSKAAESVSSTRVVAVTSLLWKCATAAARKLHGERPSILQLAVNIRGRFVPPLPRNAIGNIIWNAVAKCDSNDDLRLDTMARHINAGIAKIDTSFVEQFKGEGGFDKIVDEMKHLGGQLSSFDTDYYSSSSMCNSGLYEADFGWGRPVWSCFGYLNTDLALYTNAILLMDTSTGDGIEAWVTLSQDEMEILEHDPDLLLYASVEPSPL
uniref:stemmadenine O-acetyltransferase-like n=1 Tax=Erigeron canadensis TaxID=72917 RepID=UPI001CB8F162|nr:stemmadenine O-acetyltransferase-like [Erigeron canadensis]